MRHCVLLLVMVMVLQLIALNVLDLVLYLLGERQKTGSLNSACVAPDTRSHWLTVAHRMRRVRFQAQNTVGESARGRYVAMRLTYVCLVCVLVGGCVGVGVGLLYAECSRLL